MAFTDCGLHSSLLPRVGCEVQCDECLCLAVCPLAYLENYTTELHHFLCTLLVPPLAAVGYVI